MLLNLVSVAEVRVTNPCWCGVCGGGFGAKCCTCLYGDMGGRRPAPRQLQGVASQTSATDNHLSSRFKFKQFMYSNK